MPANPAPDATDHGRVPDHPPTVTSAVPTAVDEIDPVCEMIPGVGPEETRIARGLAGAISATTFDSGRGAQTLAAATVYVAGLITGNKQLTQSHIAETAGVSKVSIRNVYRGIPTAALDHDTGSLEYLTDSERSQLQTLCGHLDANQQSPGWNPHTAFGDTDGGETDP